VEEKVTSAGKNPHLTSRYSKFFGFFSEKIGNSYLPGQVFPVWQEPWVYARYLDELA
jgi:hypothetical protein